MGVLKKFNRVVASLLIPVLLCETAWSAPSIPALFQRQAVSSFSFQPQLQDDLLLHFKSAWENPPRVPEALGEKVASFQGNAPYRVWIIQDAHALPQAQKAAADILDFWVSKTGIRFVGLEGAEGPLPHSALAAFPNHTARKIIAETLLDEAVIGGAEYLQLTKRPSLILNGIEDTKLYEEDREAFLRVLELREAASALLKQMRTKAEEEAAKVLPVEFLNFRKTAVHAHENGDWKNYLEHLRDYREKNDLSGNYPSFDFWIEAQRLAKAVSPDALRAESARLPKRGALGERLAEYASQILSGNEPEKNVRVEAALWKQNPGWLKDFPVTLAALKASYLMRRVGPGLFDEIQRIEKELVEKMCAEENQKKLARRLENLDIALALVSLRLSEPEYRTLISRKDEIEPRALLKVNDFQPGMDDEPMLSRIFSSAKKFYEIAMRRDEVLAGNFLREMKAANFNSGALIIGGFHTAGLLHFFRQKGISYEVVRPQFRDADPSSYQSLYEERMSSQASVLERGWQPGLNAAGFKSYAQLQLLTPRRGAEFVAPLARALSGVDAVINQRPAGNWLPAAAGVVDPELIPSLDSVNGSFDSATWVSPDNRDTVFWMTGSTDEMPFFAGRGPRAQALAGRGASPIKTENGNPDIWVRHGGESPEPALSGWTRVAPRRSEIRFNDELAFVTSGQDWEKLTDDQAFLEAVSIRLRTFAQILQPSADGKANRLNSGQFVLDYTYQNGEVKVLQWRSNWETDGARERGLLLIYLEEYLSALSLAQSQKMDTPSIIGMVAARVIERAARQGLLPTITDSHAKISQKTPWQTILLDAAQSVSSGIGSDDLNRAVFDSAARRFGSAMTFKNYSEWERAQTGYQTALSDLKEKEIQFLNQKFPGKISPEFSSETAYFFLKYLTLKARAGIVFDDSFPRNGNGSMPQTGSAEKPSSDLVKSQGELPVVVQEDSGQTPSSSSAVVKPKAEPSPETELRKVKWFEGLPSFDQDLNEYSFDELADFVRIFESRRNDFSVEFAAEDRLLLPYYEKLVAALAARAPQTPILQTAPAVSATVGNAEDLSEEIILQQSIPSPGRRILIWSDVLVFGTGALLTYFGLPVLAAAFGISAAYRAGWLLGALSNEWGHLAQALLLGKWKTALLSLGNIFGNTNPVRLLAVFIPFTPLPAMKVFLHADEKGSIDSIRGWGWMWGAVFAVLSAAGLFYFLNLPTIFLISGSAGVFIAKITAFFSDFVNPPADETCAACGNLGIMAVASSGSDTVEFAQDTLRTMGDVLQVRGGQAGGSVVLRQNKEGRIFPVLRRAVNTKRGVLRDRMHANAKASLKQGATPAVYMDFRHVRFGTSSAPSEAETHPHQWLPNREVIRWKQNADGSWVKEKIILGNFISHNGDFDDFRLFGKMFSNSAVGFWLEAVLGETNATAGDSPKAAGVMDFLITQGMWDASVRYAYQMTVAKSENEAIGGGSLKDLTDYVGGFNPETPQEVLRKAVWKRFSRKAPSSAQIQTWAEILERGFQAWVQSGSQDRSVLIERLTASFPKTQGITPEAIRSFIETSVSAFFDQDPYEAVKRFSRDAEGTFGFVVGSSAYPNQIVKYGDSQPLSIGFHPEKKFLVWTSEPAVLKVPLPDGGRIPYRLDLFQDIGEVVEISLPGRGIPKLKIYDKFEKKERTHEEMQSAFRLIDMRKSPYVSPLPDLDYQNEDLVARDLREMSGALDRLREDWLKADSTNRQTAGALVQILVEKYIGKMIKDHSGLMLSGAASQYATQKASELAENFMRGEISEEQLMIQVHDASDAAMQIFMQMRRKPETKRLMNSGQASIEDPVDILITGMSTNLWAAEPFAARLSEMFPRLRIATTSSNKILRALKSVGLQRPIKKITIRENARTITISRNTIVLVADGDMGQDFAPLNSAIALRKLIGDRLFMMTPEYDTKLGALVQSFHKDAPFGKRIFRTFVGSDSGWRPAEATTLSQQAVDQTFTEILLRLSEDLRALFQNSDPFNMTVSDDDIQQLRLLNREHTRLKIPEITGYDAQGQSRGASPVHSQILETFKRWSRHISENIWTWYAVKIFILVTVTFSFPPSAWVGLLPWAESLGAPLVLLGVHAFDAVLYAGSAYIFKFLLRFVQGRETMHRQGTRSITVADVPKVNQIIKMYLTKLTAQATFLTDFFVDSSNPADHGPYRDPQRIRRGSLVVVGLTEGTLVGQAHPFKSAKLYASQGQGIQSLPFQPFWSFIWGVPVLGGIVRKLGFKLIPPEIVTVGQHPRLEANAAAENLFLGNRVNEIRASTDRLVKRLALIRSIKIEKKSNAIRRIVEGRLESFNEIATGDFNKDVQALSETLMRDLGAEESDRAAVEEAVDSYLRRHTFLTGFVEERFYQPQRIAALQVGFHHMVRRYSYSQNKLLFWIKQTFGTGHKHWETQSHLRVATTASPESGYNVTTTAAQMAESGHSLSRPEESAGAADELPFELVESQISGSRENPEEDPERVRLAREQAEMDAQRIEFIQEAQANLAKAQTEVIQGELGQLKLLADLIESETDAMRQLIYKAVFYRLARRGEWLGLNGAPAKLAEGFKKELTGLRARAGIGENFGQQSVNKQVSQIEFELLRKKYFGNSPALARVIADKALGRSESRISVETGVAAGLAAQDQMRSAAEIDRARSEMRELLALPSAVVNQAGAGILGAEMSDSGQVILERPYDPRWIRQFIAKLPAGAKVILRAPDESVIDRAVYSRELAAEMRRGKFTIEISSAASEVWLREYLKGEFDPARVIQVEAPVDPEAEDHEMLLLSAPMAAGHVLVLGQAKRLSLPGMRWIQISVWVKELYQAVKATQIAA